jgi:hypothetical protein
MDTPSTPNPCTEHPVPTTRAEYIAFLKNCKQNNDWFRKRINRWDKQQAAAQRFSNYSFFVFASFFPFPNSYLPLPYRATTPSGSSNHLLATSPTSPKTPTPASPDRASSAVPASSVVSGACSYASDASMAPSSACGANAELERLRLLVDPCMLLLKHEQVRRVTCHCEVISEMHDVCDPAGTPSCQGRQLPVCTRLDPHLHQALGPAPAPRVQFALSGNVLFPFPLLTPPDQPADVGDSSILKGSTMDACSRSGYTGGIFF